MMSESRPSYIAERRKDIMTIHGYDTFFPYPPPEGMFDFIVKSNHLEKCPFLIIARCHSTAELSEPTARAFANYILKQCDRIKALKGGE